MDPDRYRVGRKGVVEILELGKNPVYKVNIQSRQGPPEAVTVRIEILIVKQNSGKNPGQKCKQKD